MRIKDEAFIRGNVPMTKEEVRTVSLSKLDLKQDDIFLDIGAGTGSVSIQAGTEIKKGQLHAIEINPEACQLIEANCQKFGIQNLTLYPGDAVEQLEQIPRQVTKVFIGGTKGKMDAIFETLESFKDLKRVVITSITTGTLQNAIEILHRYDYQDIEIITMQINRTKAIRANYMLQAENMIFIISAGKE